VELVVQATTSMHGSKEGHMGYMYKRKRKRSSKNHCDPIFQHAWRTVENGLEILDQHIESRIQETRNGGRMTRSRGVKHTAISKIEEKEAEEKKKAKKR
jgi:hypothetical protein